MLRRNRGSCRSCCASPKRTPYSITLSARATVLGRLLDRDVGWLDAAQALDDLLSHLLTKNLSDAWAVGDKAAFVRFFRELINGGEASSYRAMAARTLAACSAELHHQSGRDREVRPRASMILTLVNTRRSSDWILGRPASLEQSRKRHFRRNGS
jgi:hypothetical protein